MQKFINKEKPISVGAEIGARKFYTRANQYSVRPSYTNIISQKNKKSKNYNANLFGDIKNLLDIRSILEYYGVQFNNNGGAIYPFQQVKTSSFKIYANSFYCFGCGAGGSIIEFVMKYFGLSNVEAAKKLNADFNLQTNDIGVCLPIEKIQQDKQLLKDCEQWEKRKHHTLCKYFRALCFWGKQLYLKQIQYFSKYISDLGNIFLAETLIDLMLENMRDFPAQVKFSCNFGEVVTAIERKLDELNA
jgi:hypothetical protein